MENMLGSWFIRSIWDQNLHGFIPASCGIIDPEHGSSVQKGDWHPKKLSLTCPYNLEDVPIYGCFQK